MMVFQSIMLIIWLTLAMTGTLGSVLGVLNNRNYSATAKLITVMFGILWSALLLFTVWSVISVIWVL